MKALVVYDSVFGNTAKIAQAIGRSLSSAADICVVQVNEVKPEQLNGLNLLIVGSPTRQFRPTPAITNFLKSLPSSALTGVKVSAFDTRIAVEDIKSGVLRFFVNVGGYAAKPIAKALTQKGGTLVQDPEGFFVNDQEGPLKDGELERAAKWVSAVRA